MESFAGLLQTSRFCKSLGVASILAFLSTSIGYGFGALFFLLFSFSFNDWVDVEADIKGHPYRAIPSKKITKKQSLVFSFSLLAIGLIYSLLFFHQYSTGFVTIYVLSITYSLIAKPMIPILATFIWSGAISILFVQPFSDNLIFYISVGCIVYGYELTLDYRDRETDKQFCKTPTLATILEQYTYPTALFILSLGVLILLYLLF